MKIIIFAVEADYSAKLIETEAKKYSINIQKYLYSDLVYLDGKILSKNKKELKINKEDKIILRSPNPPYLLDLEYNFFAQIIIEKYPGNVLLDKECYQNHPFMADKLYQSTLFSKYKLKQPTTIHAYKIKHLNKFPFLVKKRLSSRCKNNKIINNKQELNNFFQQERIVNYIFQEYVEAVSDFRIILFKNQPLGAVERTINIGPDGKIGVKVKKSIPLSYFPKKLIINTIMLSKKLKADLLGVDILRSKTNNYYFIEFNLSPQFARFSEVTGINVAEKIIKLAQSKT